MIFNLHFWKKGPLSILMLLAALSLNGQTLAKWTFEGNTAVPTLGSGVSVSNGIPSGLPAFIPIWGTGTGMTWQLGPVGMHGGAFEYSSQCTSTSMEFRQTTGSNCANGQGSKHNIIRFAIKPNPGYRMIISKLTFKIKYLGTAVPSFIVDAHKNGTMATTGTDGIRRNITNSCVDVERICPVSLQSINDNENLGFLITLCGYDTNGAVYLDDVEIQGTVECGSPTNSRCADSLELVNLYNSTNGANWTNKWILTQPMDNWYGITLTNGRVTCIDLDGNNNCELESNSIGNSLVGTIPNLNLPNLQQLFLNSNRLSDTIPNFNLPNLIHLGLSKNQLSGKIPNFTLPKLEYLNLTSNQLSGEIPNFILLNLQYLEINNNQLNTTIPNFILPNLRVLNLASNQLINKIPNFNLINLQYLDVNSNQLSDTIPNFVLPNLEVLALSSNQLSGKIPNFNLAKLKYLNVGSNQLSGTIPNFILSNLQELYLNSNQLNGCIPQGIRTQCSQITASRGNLSNTPNLATQSWQNYWNNGEGACAPCPITGTITGNLNICGSGSTTLTATTNAVLPTYLWSTGATTSSITASTSGTYGVTITQSDGCTRTASATVTSGGCRCQDSLALVDIYNSANGTNWTNRWNLNQPMDTWYGVILNNNGCVRYLNLYNNGLSGTINTRLYTLTSLDTLSLGLNNLLNAWSLPTQFGNLTQLKEINFHRCNLTGVLPPSIGNLVNMKIMSLSGNNLTGSIPQEIGQMSVLDRVYFGANPNLTGPIPTSIGNITTLRDFRAEGCNLTGPIPTELGNCRNLEILNLNTNPLLSGSVPFSMRQTKLNLLDITNGDIDSLPNLSNLPIRVEDASPWGLRVSGNRLTFDDILPNINFATTATYVYTEQDSISTTRTITLNTGQPLSIDLNIDGAITDNVYSWKKDGVTAPNDVPNNINRFIKNSLTLSDAGVYTCTVTNPRAPNLTLNSRSITVVVNQTCNVVISSTTPIPSCGSNNGKINLVWTGGTSPYRINYAGTATGSISSVTTTSQTFTGLATGTYNITVTDANNCTATTTATVAADNSCRCNDSLALIRFYDATGGTGWRVTWNKTQPMSTWFGVTLNPTSGCVETLDLDGVHDNMWTFSQSAGNGLNSTNGIPSAIGRLTNLTRLYIGFNTNLSGSIPDSIGYLTQLTDLYLEGNRLSGSLPPRFNQLTNIQGLSLAKNENLTGSVSMLSSLTRAISIHLYNNKFSGSDFTWVNSLLNLQYLTLNSNQFTGQIPTFLPNRLRQLHIQDNDFTGLANLTGHPFVEDNNGLSLGLRTSDNRLTFEHIIPNISLSNSIPRKFWYAPQDSFYTETTYTKTVGENQIVSLGIDPLIPNNSYQWRKIRGIGDTIIVATVSTNSYTFSNLQTSDAGIYEVRVTNPDAPDLTLYSRKITIVVNCIPASTPSVSSTQPAVCIGESTRLTATGTLNNATNWQWYSSSCSGTPIGSGTFIDVSPTTTTGYYVRGEGGGCPNGSCALATIIVKTTPNAPSVVGPTQPTCTIPTGSVTLSGLPSGTWTINPNNITATGASRTISGLTQGTYNFTVTNAVGCTSTATANVVINTAPAAPSTPSISGTTQPTCTVSTGSTTLNGLPSGSWTINPGNITGTGASRTISGLATGTYNFTVTNAAGCTSSATTNVVINAAPLPATTPSVSATQSAVCAGETTRLTASGSLNSATNWQWYSSSCGGTPVGSGTFIDVSPTTTTSYYVRGEGGGCPTGSCALATITVKTTPTAPTATTPAPYCQNQTATALTATGSNLLWYTTATGGTGSTTAPIPNTRNAGTVPYFVSQMVNGCESVRAEIVVTIHGLPAISISGQTLICDNIGTPLTVSGGVSYQWDNGSTNPVRTVTAGNYSVTVTDANNCQNSESVAVVSNVSPVLNAATTSIANCGATLGNINLSWSGGRAPFKITYGTPLVVRTNIGVRNFQIANVPPATYTITLEDDNGCQVPQTVNFAPQRLSVRGNTTSNTCGQSNGVITLTAQGGTPPYTYRWQDGSTISNRTNLLDGSYAFTVTDAASCTANATVILTCSNAPCVNSSRDVNATFCEGSFYIRPKGDTARLAATYRDTFRVGTICDSVMVTRLTMLPAERKTLTPSVCGTSYTLPSGRIVTASQTYLDTVRNVASNGCDSIYTITVTFQTSPTANIAGQNYYCQNGNTPLTASGGVSYVWNDNTTNPLKTVSAAATYTVTVTDANGCKASKSLVITERPLPTFTISGNSTTCAGVPTTLTVNPAGFSSYNWSTGATTSSINVSQSNTYRVTVTDGFNCSNTGSANVVVNDTLRKQIDTTVCFNTNYRLPDNTTRNQTGSYRTLVKNAQNCDSLIITNLRVLPQTISRSTTASFCAGGCVTLAWGQNVCVANSYSNTTKFFGTTCDSLVQTVVVTQNSVVQRTIDTAICVGQSYRRPVSNTDETTSGDYLDTALGQNGACDTVITSRLRVNALPTLTLRDTFVCKGNALTLSLPLGFSRYQWSIGTSTTATNILTPSVSTPFSVTVTDNNRCVASRTATIVVNDSIVRNVSVSINQGQTHTLPSGVVVSAADRYRSALRQVNGCDSVIYTVLTVVPMGVDTTTCRYKDSLQLVALYNATGGNSWINKTNWLSNRSLGEWFGIRTNTEGCVTGIDLDGIADFRGDEFTAMGNNLRGILPSLSFSALTFLDLDANKGLKGDLPPMTLPEITLIGLGGDSLTGTIPSSWNFPKLQYLAVCCNQLDGTLPTLNFPKLVGLYLQNNKLKGALPTINAPLLADIRLNNNQLTGCFPSSYRQFCAIPNTFQKDFSQNIGLPNGGDFPAFCRDSLGMCRIVDTASCRYKDSLALIALYDSTGGDNWRKKTNWKSTRPLKDWYGVYTNTEGCVTGLDLDGNSNFGWSMDSMGNNLNGFLPAEIGKLSQLKVLSLNENVLLRGSLPTTIVDLKAVEYFFIRNCRFNTPPPDSLWTLPNLIHLDLGGNPFNTTLPILSGKMKKVIGLLIYNDGWQGTIPVELAQNTILKKLDLAYNNFSSIVPPILATLKLQQLDINGNNLDSFPDFSNADYRNYGQTQWGNGGVNIKDNNFTFDDILPNMRFATLGNGFGFYYHPQNPFFKDTTINARVGDSLSIDLKIDGAITNSNYKWFKNGAFYKDTNRNTLVFNRLQSTDTGEYTCQVTNPNAPLLTLISRKITVVVNPQYTVISARLLNQQDTGQVDNGVSNRECFAASDGLITAIKTIVPSGTYQWRVRVHKPDGSFFDSWEYPVPALTTTGGYFYWVWSFGNRFNQIGNYSVDFMINRDSSGYETLATRRFGIQTPCSCNDSLQLVSLYNATNGVNWTNRWDLTTPINAWFGVQTDSSGCVTCVDLDGIPDCAYTLHPGNNLVGTIPNLNLNNLQYLLLAGNKLVDTIPNFNLPNLKLLDTYNNQLTGSIPNFNLPKLETIFIASNKLSGQIPNFNLPNLKYLYLDNNRLSGSIPNFNLPELKELGLYYNQLSGRLPDLQFLPKLNRLHLSNNNLSGCFPIEWQRFCAFRYSTNYGIDSTYNITGNPQLAWQGDFQRFCNNEPQIGASCNDSLATTINDKIQADCSCKGTPLVDTTTCRFRDSLVLVTLYDSTQGDRWLNTVRNDRKWKVAGVPITNWYGVYTNTEGCVVGLDFDGENDGNGNGYTGNGLKGVFSESICQLSELKNLYLSANRDLTGSIPNSIGRLTKLTNFHFYNSGISGALPDSLWTLRRLQGLSMSGCNINAPLSSGIGNLDSMYYFIASGCNFTGDLPASIANLKKMSYFLLGNNPNLTGTIPTNINQMSALKYFNLGGNKINGAIPSAIGQLANLETLILGGNQLSDSIPTEIGNCRNLKGLYLSDNRTLTGAIPSSIGNLRRLKYLWLQGNTLKNEIPLSIGTLDSLEDLVLSRNELTGKVPASFNQLKVKRLYLDNNLLDSVPALTNVPLADSLFVDELAIKQVAGLRLDNNKFTFDGIVPNKQFITSAKFFYTPQAAFFQTITYTKNIGETLTINLGIDAALTGANANKYVWIKNGVRVDSSNQNTKILRGVLPCDAGTYTVEVTNPNAPLLTLRSKIITIVVNPIVPQTRNKTICYGQKDTLPSGQIVAPTASANYPETLRNRANTCDSAIVTTNLTVSPIVVVNKMDSFCFGKTYNLPQTNRAVTVANFYQDTITAADGCKTRYTTTLTYKTDLKRTENVTICTGQSYNLADTTVNTEGSYTRRKSGLATCDSVITTNLRLLPIPTMAKIDSFCFGKTYAFSHINQTTRNIGLFVDTLMAANGCKIRYTTTLTYKTDLTRTENVTICTGQSYNLVDTTVNTEGSFTRRKSGLVTCDSVITTNLTVLPIPTISKIDSFCEGKTYNLPQTNRIVNATGVFRDTIRNANNCIIYYATTLTYRQNLTRTERITICSGQFYRLPNDSIVRNAGVYTSRKTTVACDSLITTTLIVNPKPTAQIVGLDTLYCRDNTVIPLQGQPTGGAFRIDGVTASNFTPSLLNAGNHTVSYIYRAANGCFDTTTQTMRLGDFGLNLISRTICPGDSVTIRGKVYHQRNLTGTETLTKAAVSGCDSIITVQVTVHQKVNALDDDFEILKNSNEILIDVLKNDFYPANLYELTMKQKPNIGTIEELNNDKFKLTLPRGVSRDIVFTYQLCHLNCAQECDTALVRIKIKDKSNELDPISGGISPNGDGKNDKLDLPQIDWSRYPQNTLEIFNRWGQKVYVAKPYKQDWEGQNTEGAPLPFGDYFIILRLDGAGGKIILGNVYLTRE